MSPKRRRKAWPATEDPWLSSISAALTRRGKAIRHQAGSFDVERSFEETDDSTTQRLDFEARSVARKGWRVSVAVWADGRAWVHVCQPAKRGWAFRYTVEPNVHHLDGAAIVRRFEATLLLASSAEQGRDVSAELWSLWNTPK